jgi:hypothetical protein
LRIGSIFAALTGSLLFLFLVAPIAQLVGTAGGQGAARLFTDVELRRALVLTATTATAATLLGVSPPPPPPPRRYSAYSAGRRSRMSSSDHVFAAERWLQRCWICRC